MLQAHSYLWHYLWVAPNVFALVLGLILWTRGLRRQFPGFLAFAILGSIAQLAGYAADVSSSVTPETFWRVVWVCLVVTGLLKFVLVAEIFSHAFGSYSSLARLSRISIRTVGVCLVTAAALAAAFAPQQSQFGIVHGEHLLEQTTYLIEAGLIVFIFVFSSYFHLTLSRPVFGIALGLGISSCVQLATWAVASNVDIPDSKRILVDFLNMATYHGCVLIWGYFLLVPQKTTVIRRMPPPDANLELWNRELERLLPR
jgi:hypothetical protein